MVGDAKAGIEVRYTKAPTPRDHKDDLPTHGCRGLADQIAHSLRRGKLETKDSASHDLLNVAVLVNGGGGSR